MSLIGLALDENNMGLYNNDADVSNIDTKLIVICTGLRFCSRTFIFWYSSFRDYHPN